MTEASDRFQKTPDYAEYRWGYPEKMIDDVVNLCPGKGLAFDCGTGTGQVATMLSPHFEKVVGIDMSSEQIEHAHTRENVEYKVNSAEDLSFLEDESVDLITSGTAFHWFKQEEFFKEAKRVLKPGGVIALFGIKTPSLKDSPGTFEDFIHEKIAPHIPKVSNKGVGRIDVPNGFEEVDFAETYSEKVKKDIDAITGWVRTTSAWPQVSESGQADAVIAELRNQLKSVKEEGELDVISNVYIRVFKKI